MVGFLISWILLIAIAVFAGTLPNRSRRTARVGLPLIGLVLLVAGYRAEFGFRLLASSLFMLFVFKGASSVGDPRHPKGAVRCVAIIVWPGFDHENFASRAAPRQEAAQRFKSGLLWFYFGAALLFGTAILAPKLGDAGPWLGIAAVLSLVHFGVSNLLTGAVWLAGYPVKALFNDPFQSTSLREFEAAGRCLLFSQ